jgi:hypothetical protein
VRLPDPGKSDLGDPHARHTTTNIRNLARLIYQYGIPQTVPGLITSDQNQSAYIEDPKFAECCLKEMKCLPYRFLKRVTPYDLSFLTDKSARYYDAIDPLDP